MKLSILSRLAGVAASLVLVGGCASKAHPAATTPVAAAPATTEPSESSIPRGDALEAAVAGNWHDGYDEVNLYGEGEGREFELHLESVTNVGGTWSIEGDAVVLRFAEPIVDDAPGECLRFDEVTADRLVGAWSPWTPDAGCSTTDTQSFTLDRAKAD
ncbi:MAG TPA: hypothetical protein VHE35_34025 [Kofleriaceae bacterium]|nr:hypothetical protein [Kofleriaceae bacterium]